jgi:hypothetical protein
LTLKQFSLVQGLRLDEIDSAAAFRMVTVATATIGEICGVCRIWPTC